MDDFLPIDKFTSTKNKDHGRELIEAFASELANAASTDRIMAERLRDEITDHLTEAAAESEAYDDSESRARDAISRFGSVAEIASDYRTVVIETRSRSLRWVVILAIFVVFAVMRMRGFILEPGWRDDVVSTIWGTVMMGVDRYGFAIASMIVSLNLLIERREAARLRNAAPDTPQPLTGSRFLMLVVPAVLILSSALAGIGSLFYSHTVGTAFIAPLALPQSIVAAALLTICVAIVMSLLKLTHAYLNIRALTSG
ncbi:hypothetical protein SAMN04487972_11613 [Paracoccus halophilus]|uniref:Uncharacterized protein n=1 Tax=Paracoccus halophilus TaxID=376733 RepID=A0A099F0K6_9RHOB|nr:hypothetical protein [Paracoccus halophilus]KGJ03783.1 hypothetical protein IT41_12650 [Paracoccus halophilus]SFA56847.1 hypothetical protein SAMN04487972_11613 [Paracoccus halophilus]